MQVSERQTLSSACLPSVDGNGRGRLRGRNYLEGAHAVREHKSDKQGEHTGPERQRAPEQALPWRWHRVGDDGVRRRDVIFGPERDQAVVEDFALPPS